jgi:excisionase family DNA binding protein
VPSTTKLSPTDELWDDGRTAAFLGVSRVTVRRLRRKKLLPTVKVGSAARTPRSAVLTYVAAQINAHVAAEPDYTAAIERARRARGL